MLLLTYGQERSHPRNRPSKQFAMNTLGGFSLTPLVEVENGHYKHLGAVCKGSKNVRINKPHAFSFGSCASRVSYRGYEPGQHVMILSQLRRNLLHGMLFVRLSKPYLGRAHMTLLV